MAQTAVEWAEGRERLGPGSLLAHVTPAQADGGVGGGPPPQV